MANTRLNAHGNENKLLGKKQLCYFCGKKGKGFPLQA